MPRDLRVEGVRVRAVGADTVTIVGRYIGNEHSGFCSGGNCSSSGSDNAFTLTLSEGSTGSENGLSITALTVKDGSAVLRFAPA